MDSRSFFPSSLERDEGELIPPMVQETKYRVLLIKNIHLDYVK